MRDDHRPPAPRARSNDGVDDDAGDLPPDLALLRRAAHTLDAAFEIPLLRVRIGADALLGLVPVVGDAIALVMGSALVVAGWRHRVPGWVLARMIANVVIDAVVGAVPIVGDVFDVLHKANLKNLDLLLRHRSAALPPRPLPRLRITAGRVRSGTAPGGA